MPKLLIARAVLALAWAAALVLAVGHKVPTTDAELPAAAAALLATYPLIDVIASVFSGRRVNAAISAIAALAIAVTGFGADAGATLIAFGAWAVVSGAIQFATALHERRATGGDQIAMLISGGLSTLAGISFLSAAGMDDAHLAMLSGYMAVGAALYLVAAARGRRAQAA
jgi:uncharacterized membrane protein HdeD (DUF308 family)